MYYKTTYFVQIDFDLIHRRGACLFFVIKTNENILLQNCNMEDRNAKKIVLFNKSSLISLKAELLRKQEEVQEKKQLPQHKIENFKPHKSSEISTDQEIEPKRSLKDNLKAVDIEELEACRKSKIALQKKTALYEHLSDKAGSSRLAGNFLVDFDTKKQQEQEAEIEKVEDNLPEENVEHTDEGDEWMEFTDFLGRTRKCLKSDLDHFLKRDKELMRVLGKDSKSDSTEDVKETNQTEKPLLVQKTNDYLQSLHEKWEEKEKELLTKDSDVHYQDLLFDEARMHGVGYYSFSTDDAERSKQMEELKRQREETLRAQREAEEQRKKRDALMAARVAAARARRRARAGLPPEDPEEKKKDFNTCLLEFLTQQRNEVEAKAKEEENKMKEEKEKERQKLREAYVREWDIGKEGVEGNTKKFRELSQEEYVEQQRDKRIKEFAPPQSSSNTICNNTFNDRGEVVQHTKACDINIEKKWSDVRPRPQTVQSEVENVAEEKGLYFTTVKKPQSCLKYKNFVKAVEEPVYIVNEVDDLVDTDRQKPDKRRMDNNNAEIAPPPSYDYYGPVPKLSRAQKPFESDMREAYAQGAESLKSKCSNRKLPDHYDFTFD